jgi:hypothetical protein
MPVNEVAHTLILDITGKYSLLHPFVGTDIEL